MYKIASSVNSGITIGNINFVLDLTVWSVVYAEAPLQALIQPANGLGPKGLLKLIFDDDIDVVVQAYDELMKGMPVGMVKFRINAGNKVVWLALMPMLWSEDEKTLLLANVKVITAEVENLETFLKYANKKNSILQMLSHDLKGPLTVARSLTKILDNDNIPSSSLEKIKAVSEIIAQSIDLIEDLVDKELLDTVEAPLVKKRVNIVRKLSEYVEQCKKSEQITARNFTFVASHEHIPLRLDESKFMQVVNNLISNALKFTQPNGNIAVTVSQELNEVTITFKDDGVGIPAELQPYIFDRYTIAKREGLNGEPTTGLGLFIAKEILNWHGATILCESAEGAGTAFIINFPKQNIDVEF